MNEGSHAGSPGDGRVAVIVVAGVGDNPRSDAAQRVANGLTLWADFDPPEEHSEWYEVSDRIQPVQRFVTKSPGGTRVDLYEFWWADLSRFPAALRSFLAAFVGLFLAFPSIGRTALRDNDRVTEDPQPAPTGSVLQRLDFHLLGVLAWLVSVPVIVLSATLLMSVGAVAVAVALPDANSVTGAIALALYGSVLAFVGLGLLRHYEKQSGRRPSFALGILALLAAAGICTWRLFERGIHGASVELALADTVAELVAYPLRMLWLGILAVALTTAVLLAARLVAAGERRDERRARTVSAVIALGFGPLGIATLMAIFSAAVGAAGQKVGKAVIWTAQTGTPLCLAQPDDWGLEDCSGPITTWEFGSNLLADSIYSLAWATAVALGAVLVLALVAFSRAYLRVPTGDRADRQAGRLTRMLGVLESPWTCAILLLAGGGAAYAAGAAWLPFLPFIHPGESGSTWGPTVAAILGGAVTTLLVAGRLMGLSPSNLGTDGLASGALRALLDKPYDIATFLREPLGSPTFGSGVSEPMPRKRMLERYRALIAYVERRTYERVVFVAHSQGTILTTTLLAEDVRLRGEVSLLTFGCPLRQLYLKRFPSQYGWVERLADQASRKNFVKHVNGEWVNVAAAGDPVGRTVFRAPPEPWDSEGSRLTMPEGSPKLQELLLGKGGHSSYWTAPDLYKELGRLIEPALSCVVGFDEPVLRVATLEDQADVDALMKESAAVLFPRFYDERQAESAVRHVAQVDPMLLADGTYFVLESGSELVACGGWSRRDRLYTGSGDSDDDARLLDPSSEPARVRAMFVRADWTRRGLGRRILEECEAAARREGFRRLALVATIAGVPLYLAYGFQPVEEHEVATPDGVAIPCVSMEKQIDA